ncbi:MAG: LPS export ABC transporter periplasmic protein LptC [Xanthomonadaceae bacterium]|nr:LPS export ABC transporter periplasmic protein LptC [Xanthomonadaceae bacterium]
MKTVTLTRPWTLLLIAFVIFIQIIALTPSKLEEESEVRDQETLLSETEVLEALLPGDRILAPNIPKSKVPDYHTQQYRYLSLQGGVKQWKLQAESANVYNKEKLVHSKDVVIELYDSSGLTTWVTGDEATYHFNEKEVELFGKVKIKLADGFQVDSEYLKYLTATRTLEIPTSEFVHGYGKNAEKNRMLDFKSRGMTFDQVQNEIDLKRDVIFDMTRIGKDPPNTKIESDFSHIDRNSQTALFVMNATTGKNKFVKLNQTGLYVQSRKMDLSYSNRPEVVDYLVARDDVYIEEKKKNKITKTATSQHARFDNRENLIILTQFPQVYQDKNTVTGDRIIINRDTDLIEVEESNAFSKGK